MAPQHVLHGDEGGLDIEEIDAGHETVRRDLLGRRDDRIGAALAQALAHQVEQALNVVAALRGAGCAALSPITLIESRYRVVDYPVRGLGQDLRYLR